MAFSWVCCSVQKAGAQAETLDPQLDKDSDKKLSRKGKKVGKPKQRSKLLITPPDEAAEQSAAASDVHSETVASPAQDKSDEKAKAVVTPPDEKTLAKVHSAVRWHKSPEEVLQIATDAGTSLELAVHVKDAKTGNQVLHIACQNGHRDLAELAINSGADVNGQNTKGQTALHMSVEYDFHFLSKYLLDKGADPKVKNGDGFEALCGIGGGKTGSDAWDSPLNIMRNAGDNEEELECAFAALEAADPASLDKALVVQMGMKKGKECKDNWDKSRFLQLANKL